MNMKVIGLFSVAVLLVGVLLTGVFQMKPANVEGGSRLVFPGLKEQLSDVASITVMNPSGDSVSIVKGQDGWVLEEKSRYKVDFSILSGFLVSLSELKIVEEKTSIASNHSRLGVAENGPGAGISVTVSPGEHSLLIGNEAPSLGSFVRYENDPQVYLTNKHVEVSSDWIDWIDPVVINIEPGNIQAVTIESRSAQFLSANRVAESGDFELPGIPDGRELKYATIADSLSRLLINVRIQDVEPYNPLIFDDPSNARFVLDSGEIIVVGTVNVAGRFWMHIDRESPDKEDPGSESLAWKNKADWQFEISELTYNELNKSMAEMLKPLEVDDE